MKEDNNKLKYKSRNCLDFKNIKIGIYGIGKLGKWLQNLNSLGFNVLGWSRIAGF